ncbi:uncharacterized protein [Oryctolagus cuniculus]|uniref:uncharacterized protein n=1 Tax=Oryctolagus cuniculus TaxID=9986 RepID=UPI00387A2FEE
MGAARAAVTAHSGGGAISLGGRSPARALDPLSPQAPPNRGLRNPGRRRWAERRAGDTASVHEPFLTPPRCAPDVLVSEIPSGVPFTSSIHCPSHTQPFLEGPHADPESTSVPAQLDPVGRAQFPAAPPPAPPRAPFPLRAAPGPQPLPCFPPGLSRPGRSCRGAFRSRQPRDSVQLPRASVAEPGGSLDRIRTTGRCGCLLLLISQQCCSGFISERNSVVGARGAESLHRPRESSESRLEEFMDRGYGQTQDLCR